MRGVVMALAGDSHDESTKLYLIELFCIKIIYSGNPGRVFFSAAHSPSNFSLFAKETPFFAPVSPNRIKEFAKIWSAKFSLRIWVHNLL
jgi:hypothetical protein